eukprot:jgi/Undpi1/5948/HiC_scaffold_2.g01222.m1
MASASLKRPRSAYGGSSEDDLPPEHRICPFCSMGHRAGLEFSRGFIDIVTDSNVWASDKPTFVSNGRSFWAHSVCVHFSPQTFFDGSSLAWQYVSKEYYRARCLVCAVCGGKGASIGCHVSSCNVSCHFPCAIQELLPDGQKNWFPCQEPETPFFCTAHKEERADHERGKEIARLADLTQGRELEPIPLKMGYARSANRLAVSRLTGPLSLSATVAANDRGNNNHHSNGGGGGEADSRASRAQWSSLLPQVPLPLGVLAKGRDMDFAYVESAVGSKSAQTRQGPEREKRCCTCTGPDACRDPSTCECLRDGRNYRWKGRRLDDGHPDQVFECNLNCGCDRTSCRNRLVQKGMTCKLEVAYLGPSRRLLEGCDKKWGLRAGEDITIGTFVCTIAGQLVLASEASDSVDGEGQPSNVLVHKLGVPPAQNEAGGGVGAAAPPTRGLLLDQRRYANISRYIRCAARKEDSNLLQVSVYTTHQDPNAPVLALFAGTNIAEGTELLRSR